MLKDLNITSKRGNKQGGAIFHCWDWQILKKRIICSTVQGIVGNGHLYPVGRSVACHYLCRGKFCST